MIRSDNPVQDWDRYCDEKQRQLEKLPKCYECGEPIQTEHAYEINDELICPDCLENNHKKWVDDYVE